MLSIWFTKWTQSVILHRVRRFPYNFCISLGCSPKLPKFALRWHYLSIYFCILPMIRLFFFLLTTRGNFPIQCSVFFSFASHLTAASNCTINHEMDGAHCICIQFTHQALGSVILFLVHIADDGMILFSHEMQSYFE